MKSPNQLANSRSPYLLQRAENPVHWKEWSDDTSPTVYVCDNYACKAPVSDLEVLKAQLLG